MFEAGSAWALPSSTPAPGPREKRPVTACSISGKRFGLDMLKLTASPTFVALTVSTCTFLGVIFGGLGLLQADTSQSATSAIKSQPGVLRYGVERMVGPVFSTYRYKSSHVNARTFSIRT